MAVPCTKKC